jgi:hypothetical protein
MLVVRYFPQDGGVQIFTAKDVRWIEPGADDPISAKPYILAGDSLITDGQVEVMSDQGVLIYTLTLSPPATVPKEDRTWEPGL